MMIAATLTLGKTPCMVGAANYENCVQPPGILTWAAMSLYNVAQDASFLEDAYRAFSRNNDALYAERAEARQLFFPQSPIPPSFSVLARACLWYLGARMWCVNLPRGVKSVPNPF